MKLEDFNDPYFKVSVISKSPIPQITSYAAAVNDYSDGNAYEDIFEQEGYRYKDPFNDKELTETVAGKRVVNNCLKFGHIGVVEHPSMTLMVSGFSHVVMQQMRTHRHATFDVVSGRYTGQRIIDVAEGKKIVEEVYYVRPAGDYTDRSGRKYRWTEEQRQEDYKELLSQSKRYAYRHGQGLSEEHCRESNTSYCIRQNYVYSSSARGHMHIGEIRSTLDVQIESQKCISLVYQHLLEWMPEVFTWHQQKRMGKNNLAP